MHGTVPAELSAAIKATPGDRSEDTDTPGSRRSGADWFYVVAWAVLGKDAGLHLHHLTGFSESSCYSYCQRNPVGRAKPPAHFLQVLFSTDHGEPFFLAFMENCKAQWWVERQRDHDKAADLDSLVRKYK